MFNDTPRMDLRTAQTLDHQYGLAKSDPLLAEFLEDIASFSGRLREIAISQYVERVQDLYAPIQKTGFQQPSECIAEGDFHVGDVATERDPIRFCLNDDEMRRLLLVEGPPGSGKTSLITRLLEQLAARGVLTTVLDLKDDYRHFACAHKNVIVIGPDTPFNLLQHSPRVDRKRHNTMVLKNLTRATYGAEGITQIGFESLNIAQEKHDPPSFIDWMQAARSLHRKGESFQRSDRIDNFVYRSDRFSDRWPGPAATRRGIPHDVLNDNHIFLSDTASETTDFLAGVLVEIPYMLHMAAQLRDKLRRVLLLDEGLLSFAEQSGRIDGPVLLPLLVLLREWSTGVVLSTAHLNAIHPTVRAIAGTTVQLPLSNGSDLLAAVTALNLNKDEAAAVLRMRIGEAAVRTSKWPHVFKISVPHNPVGKAVDAQRWADVLAAGAQIAPNATFTPKDEKPAEPQQPEKPAKKLAPPSAPTPDKVVVDYALLAIMRYVGQNVIVKTTDAYRACNLADAEGDMAKAKGLHLGFLIAEKVTYGKGSGNHGIALRLSAEGLAHIGVKRPEKSWRGASGQSIWIQHGLHQAIPESQIELQLGGGAVPKKAPDLLVRISTKHAALLTALRDLALPMHGTELHIPEGELLAIECECSSVRATLESNYRKNQAAGIKFQLFGILVTSKKTELKTAQQILQMLNEPLQGTFVVDSLALLDHLTGRTK